ncbi:hypothetical protein O181_028398 [Austropuccinia psidii MF-1]|uniref:Uncharacterized protein n=1 Tax=Austropuccinia psidii MF-1 TaxID=1389203 RepID=A0A9Q3CTP8_9BASI|nr:hypothetical protein [Austropuccinia psidii MF-1]
MTDTPAPTFPPTFPLPQGGRSKGTLNDPFLPEAKRADDTDAILDQEYDPHWLRKAIAQVINTITPKMKLKVNGSNFSDWEDNMAMLLDDFLDNPEYLTTTTGCSTYSKKLRHSILTHSVSDTIHKRIIRIRPGSAVYEYLKSHYHILARASQDFKNRHGSFREDHLLGILLQHATRSRPSISDLEAIISAYNQPPNLGQVIAVIESSTQQVTPQQKMVMPGKPDPLTFQKVHVTGDDNPIEIGVDEFSGNLINPEALRMMVRGTCHICKQQGHFARNFQKGAKKARERDQNTTFQAYYPLLAPSSMQPRATDTAPAHQAPLMHSDLYRLRYKPPGVQAQFIEIGPVY